MHVYSFLKNIKECYRQCSLPAFYNCEYILALFLDLYVDIIVSFFLLLPMYGCSVINLIHSQLVGIEVASSILLS